MWSIYWRSLLGVVLVIGLTSFLYRHLSVLELIVNPNYHPAIFWCLTSLIFSVASLFERNGLAYVFWGKKLQYTKHYWRSLNLITIVFFLAFAVLSIVIHYSFNEVFWSYYKLFAQPVLLLLCPLLFGSLLKYISKHNKACNSDS
ncbi:hypothetical protein E2K93_07400 [Thalassotalea sp. HSM 43]|uniref:septation protein IspZ n=1 Tax=Thalassotalea sp. HSM 43 TaxID=2552945 RepID=UPI00107FF84D|nr:hypothetical protein E2K93_07400 [Thalassotalea sp. HSM 43]